MQAITNADTNACKKKGRSRDGQSHPLSRFSLQGGPYRHLATLRPHSKIRFALADCYAKNRWLFPMPRHTFRLVYEQLFRNGVKGIGARHIDEEPRQETE